MSNINEPRSNKELMIVAFGIVFVVFVVVLITNLG